MVKNLIFLVCACFIMAFSSCANNVEEVWINNDGSGKYEMTQDLSQLLPFAQMMMMAGDEEGGDDGGEENVKDAGMSKLKEIFARGVVDTSFVIEDLAKEMSAKKGETFSLQKMKDKMYDEAATDGFQMTKKQKEALGNLMESVVKSTLNIKMDVDRNLLKLTTSQRFGGFDKMMFSNLDELFNMFADADVSSANEDLAKIQQAKQMLGSIPKYKVKGNTVYVTRDALDLESMDAEQKQSFQMMQGMMGQSDYKTIIHVPGKVKGVNQAGATYKGSTVTWTIPYADLYDPKKDLDLRIKFKPKKKIKY